MKINIFVIGHLKQGPEKTLIEEYQKRLSIPCTLREFSVKKDLPPALLKEAESDLLLKAIPENSYVIALDERGKDISSRQFAHLIKTTQEQGTSSLTFLIGGADGHSDALRKRTNYLLSFGKLTWPHLLVRVLLMEQLYRAQQILAGHPYHRD